MLTSPLLFAMVTLVCGSPVAPPEPETPPTATSAKDPTNVPVPGPADTPPAPLALGDPVPAFTLRDQSGKERRLDEFLGRSHVLVVFYSRDFTPQATQQLRHFKELTDALADQGVVVLGISDNSWFSHKRFHQWLELTFPLLSDPDGSVATQYDARWRTAHANGSAVYFLDRHGLLRYVDRDFRSTQAIEFDELFAAIREANGQPLETKSTADLRTQRQLRTNPFRSGEVG